MQIERKIVEEMTLERFADKHGLVMQVNERPNSIGQKTRYWANFKSCEVMKKGFLLGEHGDGATEEEAIADYARLISEQLLAVDAFKPSRRNILTPRLVG